MWQKLLGRTLQLQAFFQTHNYEIQLKLNKSKSQCVCLDPKYLHRSLWKLDRCDRQDDSSAKENVTSDYFIMLTEGEVWRYAIGGFKPISLGIKFFQPTSRRQFFDVLWGFLRDVKIWVAGITTWVFTGEAASWQREWIFTSWPRHFLKINQEYVKQLIVKIG